MRRSHIVTASLSLLSLAGTGATLLMMFDARAVLRSVERANIWYVLCAVALGVVIEVVRAQRGAIMLRREYPVSLEQSFGALVLSHAGCRVVPIGPVGFGLQSLLTRRLANIPMPYSMGVFLAGSILERASVLPLIAFVLFGMRLPAWVDLILAGTLLQNILSLVVPCVAALSQHRLGHIAPRSRWGRRVHGVITDLEDGLATMVAGGWRIAVPALCLSFLSTACGLLRLALLLRAFALTVSPHQIALLMVMGGLVGSMPVRVPGSDAWATGKLLRLVRLVGPGLGGFVLLSSVIATVEYPLLAAGVLLWWAMPPSSVSLRLGEVVALAQGPAVGPPTAPEVV